MKLHFVVLLVLAFAVGLFAGTKNPYYRVEPVDENTFYVACAQGRPTTNMRLDDVMAVRCQTPQKEKN